MPRVRYEEMLPHELDAAVAAFPVAYCAFGSLEWHGQHLPLGNDTLKADTLLRMTAEKYGGVVVPPTYWGFLEPWHPWTSSGLGATITELLYRRIFECLVEVGFRAVIGVTGHDVDPQRAAIQKAVEAIKENTGATGFAMEEGDFYDLTQDRMDHAAHWETSLLMYLRPELVDLSRIAGEDLTTDEGRRAAGIFGKDPRQFASRELGETIANAIVDFIGHKAQELLAELVR
ncbi:creatininase family protein [bacterium]|nr:creatininase family protein [bacterium]